VHSHERGHGEREDEDGGPDAFGQARMLDAQHTQHDGNGEGQDKRTDCRLSENMDDAHLDFSFSAFSLSACTAKHRQ
jgi:hypothetical protein